MKNIHNTLKRIGDLVSQYNTRVDNNFSKFIGTDFVGFLVSVLAVAVFIPVGILTYLAAMFVAIFNIKEEDGQTPSTGS
jgi:hypothetical protein